MAKQRCRLVCCVLLAGFIVLGPMLFLRSDLSTSVYPDYDFNLKSPQMFTGLKQPKNWCPELTHIVYIKVPKTGSGTISSMLIDFGRNRNLTFALSKVGNHYGYESIVPEDIAPIARGKHYDLLIQHATFNITTIKNVFPKDTVIFASIREPFSHFVSAYYFYSYDKLLPRDVQRSTNETKKIITFIDIGYRKLQSTPLNTRVGYGLYNRQSLRMGIPMKHSLEPDYVRRYIDTVLDPKVELVLIQEYFDESLVLLKRRFCWSLSDIIYLSYHVQTNTRNNLAFSSKTSSQHKQLAVAEYTIYEHFYSKFWKTVLKEGTDFFEEVRAFKDIQNQIRSFCGFAPKPEQRLIISWTMWSDKFEVTGQKCLDMQLVIREFVHHRRIQQMAEVDRQYMELHV